MSSQNFIEKGKERMQSLLDNQKELETGNNELQNQLETVQNQLSEKEKLLSAELTRTEAFTKTVEQLQTTNQELNDAKQTLLEEVEKERQLASKLGGEVVKLTETVQQEKTRCEEERALCKSAYERENEAQSSELVRCVKNLQSENVQLNEMVAQLNQQIDEFKATVASTEHQHQELANLEAAKVAELETKLDQLKQAYADEVAKLKEEISELEATLTRQEHKANTATNDNERVNGELTSLKNKYEELLLVAGGNNDDDVDGNKAGKPVSSPLSQGDVTEQDKGRFQSYFIRLINWFSCSNPSVQKYL